MSCDNRARATRQACTLSLVPTPVSTRTTEITAYGCDSDEAAVFRELAPRFGVLATITDQAVTEATAALASGKRCVSIGHKTPVTRATLRALGRAGVTYISTRSVGYNHIDLEFAARLGIRVDNVAYSPDSVADHTVMLILMALRHARSILRQVEAGDYRLCSTPGRELRDLTVGVVGTGRIGTAVLDRLRGFGCQVLTHDLHPTIRTGHVPLDTLVRHSDIVTLHTPLTEETHHLLDADRIQRMKHGAVLVNTGRGTLVDTPALLSALTAGRLAGAALDVLEGEEGVFYTDRRDGSVDNDLLLRLQALPNVLITPHTAYHTDHALHDMVVSTLVNCLDHEGGEQHG